jgi:hypothetical protein
MEERKESMLYYAGMCVCVCVCVLAESNERAAPLGSPLPLATLSPPFLFNKTHTERREKWLSFFYSRVCVYVHRAAFFSLTKINVRFCRLFFKKEKERNNS